ncbi:helix-turn-helix domain-containing protein [Ammonicoccus fulvus]|uniref:Helix-turn-helix domain-containing protein n=1 Tax=Ammonicoccus fulvus TaxID=3138240 RepID=A0ABZ3FNT2_9ACTN
MTPGPREQLLDKAITHFAREGVRDTSLRGLAPHLGTSQRMLSYHFGSREGLLTAVIDKVVADTTSALRTLFDEHADPFEAGRENWRRAADGARLFGALFFELSSHAMYGKDYARDLGQTVVTRTEEAFAEAYRSRTDEATARVLARLTLAVGNGLLFSTLIDADRAASDAAVEEFITLVRARVESSARQ